MNGLILAIILSGVLLISINLIFHLLPISIFPCVLTNSAKESVQSVCSLGYVSEPHEYVSSDLTSSGEFLRIFVLDLLPVAIGFLAIFRLSESKQRTKRTS